MAGVSADPESGLRRISSRVAAVTPSATLAIDGRAKALKAAGQDIIGFGAGEPDFPTPPHVVEAAAAACRDPANHRYTPTAGLGELREAVVARTATDSGLVVSPSQVLITNGGKHAVFNAFAALVDPGDEVLLPTPYWTTYPEIVTLAGGTVVPVPAGQDQGFRVRVDQLEAARSGRTKALVFVSPSNPSGAVYRPEEVQAIGRWAAGAGIWVVADEIYQRLVYGEHRAVSMPAAVPELAEHCVVVNGVAKTYGMTGWRVGWMIGPDDVVRAAVNLQSHTTSNVANVAQRAALAALTGDQGPVEAMREAFDRRRRRIWGLLREVPGVSCMEPEGAFYAFPSLAGLLGRPFGTRRPSTTLELAEVVLERAGVAFVPGEAFGAPGYGRFSYALSDSDLEEGITRLAKLALEAMG
jgi:aspartate aminotransferase